MIYQRVATIFASIMVFLAFYLFASFFVGRVDAAIAKLEEKQLWDRVELEYYEKQAKKLAEFKVNGKCKPTTLIVIDKHGKARVVYNCSAMVEI